jgi:hypothetical protein
VNRKLVIALLIVLSIAVLGAAYWVSRPATSATPSQTVPEEQEETDTTTIPVDTPPLSDAQEKAPVTVASDPEVAGMPAQPVVAEEEKTESRPSLPLPLPEDPLLAALLDSTGGLSLRAIRSLPVPSTVPVPVPEQETEESTLQPEPVQPPVEPETPIADTTESQADTFEPLAAEVPAIMEEHGPEMMLSVSFFDRQLEDFSGGIHATLDIRSADRFFSFGTRLSAGMTYSTPYRVYASLKGTATWNLGDGTVTFPLSIGLGPMLQYDQTDGYAFGIAASADAGVRYMITDSIGILVSVGIEYQLEIPSLESQWILSPLRIGIGFRF